MADQFAANDPGVFSLGAATDSGEARRTEAGQQRRVAEDRIHARGERGRVRGEAVIRAAVVLTDMQDGRRAGDGREWAQ